jgi:hypothetical protein
MQNEPMHYVFLNNVTPYLMIFVKFVSPVANLLRNNLERNEQMAIIVLVLQFQFSHCTHKTINRSHRFKIFMSIQWPILMMWNTVRSHVT